MKFEIDLGNLLAEYDEEGAPASAANSRLREAIETRAAELLLSRAVSADDRYDIIQKINSIRHEVLYNRIAAEVDAAFDQPIRRSSPWGESKGDPVTILELIRLELESFLGGKQTRRDRHGSDSVPQNLAELIQDACKIVMQGALSTAIVEAKQEVTNQVRDHALKAAVAALTPDPPKKIR